MSIHQDDHFVPYHEEDESHSNAEIEPSLQEDVQEVNAIKEEPEDEIINGSESPVKHTVKIEPETTSKFHEENKEDVEKKIRLPQVISIQWLNMKKVPYGSIKKQIDCLTLDDLSTVIGKIVDTHNNKGKKTGRNINKDKEVDTDDEETETEDEDEDQNDTRYYGEHSRLQLDTQDYRVKIYSCFRAGTTCLSKVVMPNPEKTQSYSFLFFFYQENPPRIISATTGTAWHVVNPYVDYTFPKKVVSKIGDSDKIKEIVKLCLFGECRKKTLTFPEKLTFYGTSCLYDLVSSLTCGIKQHSSLYDLLCQISSDQSRSSRSQPKPGSSSFLPKQQLQQLKSGSYPSPPKIPKMDSGLSPSEHSTLGSSLIAPPRKPKPHFYITINNGGVRIQEKFVFENYPKILDLFTDFMKEDNGVPVQDNERKDNRFAFLHFLQPSHGLKNELDDSFMEEIFREYRLNQQLPVRIIYHKNLDDFLYSKKFEIKISREHKYEELESNPPDIEEVLNKIMGTIQNKDDKEQFKTFVGTTTLKFTKKDSKTKSVRLFDCLEAEHQHPDGKSYFKIRNMWYAINADHRALLQEDFIRVYRNALIPKPEKSAEKSEGYLPATWESYPKILTETLLQNRLSSTVTLEKSECREIINSLLKCRVYYVNEGIVKQKKLVGEILQRQIISKNQDSIEEILDKSEKLAEVEAKIQQKFGKNAKEILEELQKEREVLTKKKSNEKSEESNKKSEDKYVLNPFIHPLKQILEGENETWKETFTIKVQDTLTQLLVELYKNSLSRRNEEWTYNSTYLKAPYGIEEKYLVFDKINPDNIEPCDILKYTNENVYLYQVKDELGQHTREACSQILNAATVIRSALSIDQSNNYLQNLWTEANKKNYENQLASFKEKDFIDIFRNRNLIFVYAYCPRPSHNFSGGVKNALTVIENPEDKDRLFEKLTDLKYLDKYEQVTYHIISEKEENFKLEGEFEKLSGKVFKQLRNYYDFCKSSIAKMEIVRLAHKVRELGFEFKICEITKI